MTVELTAKSNHFKPHGLLSQCPGAKRAARGPLRARFAAAEEGHDRWRQADQACARRRGQGLACGREGPSHQCEGDCRQQP